MTSTTPARVEPRGVIQELVRRYEPIITNLLDGTGIGVDTYRAWFGNATRQNEDLWKCVPETVLGAVLRSAHVGLAPNTGDNLCWIIPRKNTKHGGRLEANYQIGYGGVMELCRRAMPGTRFEGRPVYPNDVFDPGYSDDKPFRHVEAHRRRPPKERGGPAVEWYVRAFFPPPAQGIQTHSLRRDDVEHHRQFSSAPDSPMWTQHYDAAALKTVVLDMRRWLPNTPVLSRAVAAEQGPQDIREIGHDEGDESGETAELDPPDTESEPES